MAGIPTVGKHLLLELHGCDAKRINDAEHVRATLVDAANTIGATIVGEAMHAYSPQGVTAVLLISESHLSCHTWPEKGYVAIDFYTCGNVDPDKAVARVAERFAARSWHAYDVRRGLAAYGPTDGAVKSTQALYDRRRFHTPLRSAGSETLDLTDRREIFATNGIVDITGLVSDDVYAEVKNEALSLLERFAERRDLLLATTDNTPRFMSVVRSELIGEHGALIRRLYTSPEILEPLEHIAGERLFECPLKDEEFLITKHHTKGDTHGWHWGDYDYAAIWVLEAPPIEVGGMLQCVPHTSWNKSDPRIHEYLASRPIDTYYFRGGSIYLLRTDTTLHRTVPLNKDATRIILNMTWASQEDLKSRVQGEDRWWEDKNATAAKAYDH